MDGRRIGRVVRVLRHRLCWRQLDLAGRAGLSQSLVSLIERGHIEAVAVGKLEAVLRALDADLVLLARWRGGDLDRLLDEAHARLVGVAVELLTAAGWAVEVEVTYAVDFEQGSIDILAWHSGSAALLAVEVKSELVSVEETLRRHDAKARLAARIAVERFGWRGRTVARLLVLPEGTTPRRRVARHDAVLARAYPLRSIDARAWLSAPTTAQGSLVFLPSPPSNRARGRSGSPTRKRVRRAVTRSI
ncbi:MAG: hypothetical protein C0498_04610 [Anaerolinea sp.]|nr:hypothetical protein [Anaerolinea sp.]